MRFPFVLGSSCVEDAGCNAHIRRIGARRGKGRFTDLCELGGIGA